MAGAINGTVVVVNNATGVVVGQGDFTHTYDGKLIEVTTKGSGDGTNYMEGENSGKQHIFSGEFIYNGETQFRNTRADVFSVTARQYTIVYIGDLVINESFVGDFFPTDLNDVVPQGGAMKTTIAFKSNSVVSRTKASDELLDCLAYDPQDYVARWELESGGTGTASPTDYEAYWTMDNADISGAIQLDQTANNNDATLIGTAGNVVAQLGEGYDFSGGTGRLQIAHSATTESTLLTQMAWIKTATGGASLTIFSQWGLSGGSYTGFSIYTNYAGKVTVLMAKGGGAALNLHFVQKQSVSLIAGDVFTHVAMTYDGSNIKIYINGVLDATHAWASGLVFDSGSDTILIGARSDDQNATAINPFYGVIDEVKRFNRPLAESEILAVYNEDIGSNTTALDSSYNANHGTIFSAPTFGTGQIGNALTFDGVDDYIEILYTNDLRLTDMTISAWVKVGVLGIENVIMSDLHNGAGDDAGWQFVVTTGNQISLGINDAVGNSPSVISTTTLVVGTWYYLVGIYDNSNIKVYVNAALENTTAASNSLVYGINNTRQHIGHRYQLEGDTDVYFNGSIDDVRLYDRALSLTEIEGIFASRNVAPPVDFVAEWKMDSDVLDTTGNHNATAVGAPVYATGKEGNALVLNGTTQYATVVDDAALRPTQLTIAYWVKNGVAGWIMQSWDGTSANAGYWVANGSNPAFTIGSNTGFGDGVHNASVSSVTAINDGNWHFVVCTYDAATLKIYIDGVEEATTTYAGGIGYAAANKIHIGVREEVATKANYFDGSIDKLQVFSRAVTQAEVTAMYATTPVACP